MWGRSPTCPTKRLQKHQITHTDRNRWAQKNASSLHSGWLEHQNHLPPLRSRRTPSTGSPARAFRTLHPKSGMPSKPGTGRGNRKSGHEQTVHILSYSYQLYVHSLPPVASNSAANWRIRPNCTTELEGRTQCDRGRGVSLQLSWNSINLIATPRWCTRSGIPRMLLVLILEFEPRRGDILIFFSVQEKMIKCWERLALIDTIRRESSREGRAQNRLAITVQSPNRSGEGGGEPAMWLRVWVTTRRERGKKRKYNRWDGGKIIPKVQRKI